MDTSTIPLVAAALVVLIFSALWWIVRLGREWKAQIPAEVWAEARRQPWLPPNERWRLSPDQREAVRARRDRHRESSAA